MSFFKDLDPKLKKSLMIFSGVIVGIIILIVIIISIVRASSSSNLSYTELEERLLTASKSYYAKKKDALPTDNTEVSVSSETLVKEKYLTDLGKLAPKGITCTGSVKVSKNNEDYLYVPVLDCGDDYKTTTMYDKITSQVTTSRDGLYSMNNEYVYRGEKVSNYVKINGYLWRIVKIDSQESLVLILNTEANNYIFDDRYNSDKSGNVGFNDFNVSRIKDRLNSIYKGLVSPDDKSVLIDDTLRSRLVPYNMCIGARTNSDTNKDSSLDCSRRTDDMLYVGLLPVYDFLNASLDEECTSTTSITCQNYNYLVRRDITWWTATPSALYSYQNYAVTSNGVVTKERTSSSNSIRPVIYLKAKYTNYASGTGTYSDPYLIR